MFKDQNDSKQARRDAGKPNRAVPVTTECAEPGAFKSGPGYQPGPSRNHCIRVRAESPRWWLASSAPSVVMCCCALAVCLLTRSTDVWRAIDFDFIHVLAWRAYEWFRE